MIIAIDGPAGSGKSTSAKLLAQKLGCLYIDTGAMYRAVTYLALKNNIIHDEASLIKLAEEANIILKFQDFKTYVWINGEEVTEPIRSKEINDAVSIVAKVPKVRESLVRKQKEMAEGTNVVMEGRDITTVVFPAADVKIYLTATIDERTRRRVKEYAEKGIEVSFDEIKFNLEERDRIDSSRENSPLKKADDAVEVDTSDITIDEQVDIIYIKARAAAAKKGLVLESFLKP